MPVFLVEFLQLPYFAYFKPSALQTRLNRIEPKKRRPSTLGLPIGYWTSAAMQRLLAQCTLWWLLGLLFFGYLTGGAMPWWGMLLVGIGLFVGGSGIAVIDLPHSLAFPLMAGLAWGLNLDLWPALQSVVFAWPNWPAVGLLIAVAVFGAVLAALGATRGKTRKRNSLAIVLPSSAVSLAGGIAVVVMNAGVTSIESTVAGGLGVGMSVGVVILVMLSVADAVADHLAAIGGGITAVGVVGGAAGGIAGRIAEIVAGNVAVGVAGGLAGIAVAFVAFLAMNIVWRSPRASATNGAVISAAVAMAISIVVSAGGVVAVVLASSAVGIATLPLIAGSMLALILGLVLSHHRLLWAGPMAAITMASLFIKPQEWVVAGLIFFIFLLGYFRLLFYPPYLMAIAVARRLPLRANKALLYLPPFIDEIVWLPLFGLGNLLTVAYKEDRDKGEQARQYIAGSFRQGWAAREALLEVSAWDMARYDALTQIAEAPDKLLWMPDEPYLVLPNVGGVLQGMEEIARQVKAGLNATSDYSRLRRFNLAYASLRDFRQSLTVVGPRYAQRFRPITEQWENLISSEINRLAAEGEAILDIPNPYITGIPVQPDEDAVFAQRLDLVRAVESALTTAHGKPTIALFGPRRMGKTTFLLHLPHLLPDEIVPVFVDLQEAVQVSGLGALFYNWAVAIFEAVSHRRLDMARPTLESFSAEPAIAWREWLDGTEGVLGQRKLFLTFDEFEWLVTAAETDLEMKSAFSILRHLSQHRPRIYLLFAGAHRLEEMAPGGCWHDYFISVRPLEVSYLDETEARRLITNPIPDFPLDYAAHAVDEIIHLTHCQPMLVQLMGSILVDWLNNPIRRQQGNRLVASLEDIALASREIPRQGRPYFANLWFEAGDEGQRVLGLLCQTSDGLSSSELLSRADLAEDELRAVLSRLEQYQLIERGGDSWRIQVELTRRAFVELARSR